ncbi:hypothetical protein TFLX_06292 [Thermoflexales bacterium]|nr:hypothetical protein TFLX_06292 [Thermoflexales bacterium]
MSKSDTFWGRLLLRNGALLILPPMVITFGLWAALPPRYSFAQFWKDIPSWLGFLENLFRILVFGIPVLLYFGRGDKTQSLGWYFYSGGLIVYLASYLMQIVFPYSDWSMSVIGFSAPAWSTLVWLIGIGFVCSRSWLPLRWSRLIYLCCTVLFLIFHTGHTLLIYSRIAN